MGIPETRYARSGDVHIAYQVVGEGPVDLVWVPALFSHVEMNWQNPKMAAAFERLASFARLVVYDRRGTGLSDRATPVVPHEQHVDDLVAVLDAVGIEAANLYGYIDGGIISLLHAAAYPDRTKAVIVVNSPACVIRSDDYPQGFDPDLWDMWVEQLDQGTGIDIWTAANPHSWSDVEFREWNFRYFRASISPGDMVAFMRAMKDVDIRSVLPAVQAPTLVMWLAEGVLFPPALAEPVTSGLPNGSLQLVPGEDFVDYWSAGALDDVEAFVTGVRPAPTIDRVLATVLFLDIAESTPRVASLGDRRWRETLDRFDMVVRRELDRFRGVLVDTAGDGLLATFDGPARAIRCAQALRDSLLAIELETRSGLHTGEIELRGDNVAGIAVHIASRVMTEAAPGEIVVSSTVRDLVVGSGISFGDKGRRVLKGVPDEWQLLSVVG